MGNIDPGYPRLCRAAQMVVSVHYRQLAAVKQGVRVLMSIASCTAMSMTMALLCDDCTMSGVTQLCSVRL
jgi:hypothetical protein